MFGFPYVWISLISLPAQSFVFLAHNLHQLLLELTVTVCDFNIPTLQWIVNSCFLCL